MGRLLTLGVLAALLYLGFNQARPWLEARFAAMGLGSEEAGDDMGGSGEEGRCLHFAERANDTFASVMRQFSRPPVDQREWTGAFLAVSAELGDAQVACACAEPVCGPAAEAMSELRELTLSFDGVARGNSRGIDNPALRQARIEELLDEARRLGG